MRVTRVVFSVSLAFLLSISLAAQQTTTPSPQALALLQKSLSALGGSASLTDVTLSGTARRIAGSADESGTVVFKALATGESRLDLVLPSGRRSEVRANSSGGPTGMWLSPDATSRAISQHNLLTDSSWFFSAFTVSRLLTNDYVVSYVGNETKDGQAVSHLTAIRQFQATDAPTGWTPDSLQHLSAMDIYFDTSTLLPSALRFNTHPDRNQTIDIPVEIRFSDYRQTNGALIAYHVQKYLNNCLAFDFQINTVSLNSGLSTTSFAVQAGL